jgi:acyl carrier protein
LSIVVSILSKESIWNIIVESLKQLMLDQDQELGEVTPATAINNDLGIASIDIIHLMVGLEDRLETQLNFDELVTLPDGSYRQDLTLGELLDFVYRKAVADSAGEPAGTPK